MANCCIREASSLRQEKAVKDSRQQIAQAKKRHVELDGFLLLGEEKWERPLLLWELQTGERYELVFTNRSGRYRWGIRTSV